MAVINRIVSPLKEWGIVLSPDAPAKGQARYVLSHSAFCLLKRHKLATAIPNVFTALINQPGTLPINRNSRLVRTLPGSGTPLALEHCLVMFSYREDRREIVLASAADIFPLRVVRQLDGETALVRLLQEHLGKVTGIDIRHEGLTLVSHALPLTPPLPLSTQEVTNPLTPLQTKPVSPEEMDKIQRCQRAAAEIMVAYGVADFNKTLYKLSRLIERSLIRTAQGRFVSVELALPEAIRNLLSLKTLIRPDIPTIEAFKGWLGKLIARHLSEEGLPDGEPALLAGLNGAVWVNHYQQAMGWQAAMLTAAEMLAYLNLPVEWNFSDLGEKLFMASYLGTRRLFIDPQKAAAIIYEAATINTACWQVVQRTGSGLAGLIEEAKASAFFRLENMPQKLRVQQVIYDRFCALSQFFEDQRPAYSQFLVFCSSI